MSDPMGKFINIMNFQNKISGNIIDDIINDVPTNKIKEDLNEVVYKLETYFDPNPDQNYQDGLFDGIQLALNMIKSILDRD